MYGIGICAISWVALPGTVVQTVVGLGFEIGQAWLFQSTTEVARKFVPVMVSVNAAPPTVVLDGDNAESVGAAGLAAKIVKAIKFERLFPAVVALVLPGDSTPTDTLAGAAK